MVATVYKHGACDSGGVAYAKSRQRKTPKGGTKRAREPGGTRGLGKARENLQNSGDPEKRDRWQVSERQFALRSRI
jgi:hypothetical protein